MAARGSQSRDEEREGNSCQGGSIRFNYWEKKIGGGELMTFLKTYLFGCTERHVGSSSTARDRTCVPCIGSVES